MCNNKVVAAVITTLIVAMTGCEEDERVSQVARQAADRQAAQNQQIAHIARQAAEGSRELVAADAQARREIIKVHQEMQSERATLGEQWNKLETERQEIAQDRRTESLLVPALQSIGAIAVAVLAIGFCLFMLFGLRKTDDTDAQLGELLVHEIVADQPRLLPPSDSPALPGTGATSLDPDSGPLLGADHAPENSNM